MVHQLYLQISEGGVIFHAEKIGKKKKEHTPKSLLPLVKSFKKWFNSINSINSTSRSKEIPRNNKKSYVTIRMFPKIVGFSPQIIHFNRVFHYVHHPFGVPLFLETPMRFFMVWKFNFGIGKRSFLLTEVHGWSSTDREEKETMPHQATPRERTRLRNKGKYSP